MGLKESTSEWPLGAERIVKRIIPNASVVVAFRHTKTGNNVISKLLPGTCQLVISYYYPKKVFLVWNAAVHHHIHNKNGQTTVGLGAGGEAMLRHGFQANRIDFSYKDVKQNGYPSCVEKVIIVGVDALCDFCRSYQELLLPDMSEVPKGKLCLYAVSGGELHQLSGTCTESYQIIERERENVARLKRDPIFREKVLQRWNYHCIVCGASERTILEAAHIESVKSGGSDDPANGYCLCANHHRMYDSALLNIHEETNSFSCSSVAAKEMPWYREAERKGFHLHIIKD